MDTIICYIFIYIVEAYILCHYCSHMLYSKYSKTIEYLTLIPLYTILFLVMLQENILINTITFLIINFIYIYFIFLVTWGSALFHAGITTVIMCLSEVIIANLIPNLVHNFYDKNTHLQKLIILAIFSKILYLLFSQTIIFFFGRTKDGFISNNKGNLSLIIIPIITMWIMITLLYVCDATVFEPFIEHMILISSMLLLIINFITFSIYRYNQEKEAKYREMQLQLQKEKATEEYYQMLHEENENRSILIHDIKKHLHSISSLNMLHDHKQLEEYLDNLINSPSLQVSVRVCDNNLLNTIIYRYQKLCADKGIALYTDIRSKCIDFLPANDLTALICNLLDNAVEAATPGSNIEIHIKNNEQNDYVSIAMLNPCPENPFTPTGRLITRKADKTTHGYGMKSVERIANKYEGYTITDYRSDTKTFCNYVILRNIQE